MTNCTQSLAKPIGARSGSLSRLVGTLTARYLNWRRRRRDRAVLLRHPEYLLRDIGLERREIDGAVRGRRFH